MVLVEVVQIVVDLRILEVNVGRESNLAWQVTSPELRTDIVVAHRELIEAIRLLIEDVAETRVHNQIEKEHIEATAPGGRDDLVVHVVVDDAL